MPGIKDFKLVTDAGETIVLSRNALIHVEKEVMDRVRPARFREILRVDSSVPDWVQQYSYDKITMTGEWKPAQEYTEDFATSNARVETAAFNLFEMVSGYRFGLREMVRAQKMGVNLDASRAAVIMQKAETLLEHVAADGTYDGVTSLGGLTGLYNVVGASVLTASDFVGNTTSWQDRILGAADSDAYDAACEAIIDDCLAGEDYGEAATKETTPPDTVVIPLSQKKIMRKSKSRSDKTLEQHVLERAKHIKRVQYWSKPDLNAYGADGTHKRRVVWLTASDMDAARFVLPKAATPGRPVQLLDQSVHTPLGMVIGGFNTKMPSTIIYADLKDDA